MTLAELVRQHGAELLGRHHPQARFPLLLKFLDAARTLSVQVHPNDAQAARLDPPDLGKTEAWVVLAAEQGATIYAGLRPGVDRPSLAEAIRQGRCQEVLHQFQPKVGDCVFLPAGTVHALGEGLLVAEIQQASDTTYRLFDWNRVGPDGKPRPLHVEQALEVIDYGRGPVRPQRPESTGRPGIERLVSCDKFVLDRWQFDTLLPVGGDQRCHILVVLEGAVSIEGDPWPARLSGDKRSCCRLLWARSDCGRRAKPPCWTPICRDPVEQPSSLASVTSFPHDAQRVQPEEPLQRTTQHLAAKYLMHVCRTCRSSSVAVGCTGVADSSLTKWSRRLVAAGRPWGRHQRGQGGPIIGQGGLVVKKSRRMDVRDVPPGDDGRLPKLGPAQLGPSRHGRDSTEAGRAVRPISRERHRPDDRRRPSAGLSVSAAEVQRARWFLWNPWQRERRQGQLVGRPPVGQGTFGLSSVIARPRPCRNGPNGSRPGPTESCHVCAIAQEKASACQGPSLGQETLRAQRRVQERPARQGVCRRPGRRGGEARRCRQGSRPGRLATGDRDRRPRRIPRRNPWPDQAGVVGQARIGGQATCFDRQTHRGQEAFARPAFAASLAGAGFQPGRLIGGQFAAAAAEGAGRRGAGSRRQCEELIIAGRVEVDRQVVTELGTRVDPAGRNSGVDGVPLPRPKLVYYAVNKPDGVVSTNRDPAGRPRVIDLVPRRGRGCSAVGRLDLHSEGLILVTNDGELANRLTHPRYGVEKTYRVLVAGRPTTRSWPSCARACTWPKAWPGPSASRSSAPQGEHGPGDGAARGRNREIRRILAEVGHKVLRLMRIAVGPVRLGDLAPGECRLLTHDEVEALAKPPESASRNDAGRGARRT